VAFDGGRWENLQADIVFKARRELIELAIKPLESRGGFELHRAVLLQPTIPTSGIECSTPI